jgi:hypothetical protein
MKKSRLFLNICFFFILINFNSILVSAEYGDQPFPGCNLVYYSQGDPNWHEAYVGGAQFGPHGCGPTCLAMIASSFGHVTSPLEWGHKMNDGGFWDEGLPISKMEGDIVTHTYSYAISLEGLNETPLRTLEELINFLKTPYPVIGSCDFHLLEPPFTDGKLHAVILHGYQDGKTFLIDPSSNSRTGWWDIATIFNIRRTKTYEDKYPKDRYQFTCFRGVSGRPMYAGVYRLYNPFVRDNPIQLPGGVYNEGVGLHHYTMNIYEIEKMLNEGWSYEQVAFLDKGEHPLYRLFNPNDGNHHFTMNVNERDDLVNRGWHDEGVGWKVALAGQPVFRIYNPGNGEHIYTLNYEEVKAAVAAGMIDEGVAWWC